MVRVVGYRTAGPRQPASDLVGESGVLRGGAAVERAAEASGWYSSAAGSRPSGTRRFMTDERFPSSPEFGDDSHGEGRARDAATRVRPTSFAQQRLWFLDQLDPGNPAYNVQVAASLRGPLDVAALEAALTEIVRRHETLRTTFSATGGEPRQIISLPRRLRLSSLRLTGRPEDAREAEALRLVSEEAMRPFDLSRGPLFRTLLIGLGDEHHIVVLTMHHIITDGWSTGILFRELRALYLAFLTGRPSPLPEPQIQYADFAVWQREQLHGEVFEKQLAYWKSQLGGNLPAVNLPTDRPRPRIQSYRGARQSFLLSREMADALKALSLDESATPYMTLLAAFAILLFRYAHQDEIVIGTPIAGRTSVEVEDLIGFFVNPLVLRIDLSGDPTFRELLRRVREVALDAFTHPDVPFEKIVEALRPERNLGSSPLFQVWFVLQNSSNPELELEGLTVTPLEPDDAPLDRGPAGTARHDLRLGLYLLASGALSGTVEYKTDLFAASTIVSMIRNVEILLGDILERPDTRLSVLVDRMAAVEGEEETRRTLELREAARRDLTSSRRRPLPSGAADRSNQ
jgi:Condensation domain